jgi:hypothetical protein
MKHFIPNRAADRDWRLFEGISLGHIELRDRMHLRRDFVIPTLKGDVLIHDISRRRMGAITWPSHRRRNSYSPSF